MTPSTTAFEVARDHSTQECFQEQRAAYGDAALSYRTVARWVKLFREGRDAVQDNLHRGRSHVENNKVQVLASLMHADRQWTARDLAAEIGVCHKTVLYVLHDILRPQSCSAMDRADLVKFPRYNNDTAMQSHRHCWTGTKGKATTFLDESTLWTKPGLAHTNQT